MHHSSFGLLVIGAILSVATSKAALVDAVKSEDVAAIRNLLEQSVDVNAAGPDGATALHWAAHLDNPDTAKLLVQAGADAEAANRYGVRPLTLACTNGNMAMVELLIEAGADPNTALPEGETVLMTCSRTGRVEPVRALLRRGAHVNAKENWRGQTALMWAASEGHVAVVRSLIEAGAQIDVRSGRGFTALLFAVRQGQQEVVKALIEAGADISQSLPPRRNRNRWAKQAKEVHGPAALDLAVANAHYEVAALLLEAGANPNGGGQGWTPLHTITWVRRPGTGSNDPAPAGSGNMSSLDMVRKLVRHRADVNARIQTRRTVVRSVLNTEGATPFLMAARTGDAELMQLLLDLGADPSLPNADGTTPVIVAAGVGTQAPGEDAGEEAEVVEALKVALAAGNDINAVDKNGESAMHGAAYQQLPLVVRYLAESGADIDVWNQKNRKGWTPLRIAAGVHRTGNYRSSPETAAAFREVMESAGVSTVLEAEAAAGSATRDE